MKIKHNPQMLYVVSLVAVLGPPLFFVWCQFAEAVLSHTYTQHITSLIIAIIIMAITTIIPITVFIKDLKLNKQQLEDIQKNEFAKTELKVTQSYAHQLTSAIAGLNHEVSPWIGASKNQLFRLQGQIEQIAALCPNGCKNCNLEHQISIKLKAIHDCLGSATKMLQWHSKSAKRMECYNMQTIDMLSTIKSWRTLVTYGGTLGLLKTDKTNIIIKDETLNWVATHSPMILAQILINLVDNTIEHNADKIEDLRITISGDPVQKTLIYEDNGVGIPGYKMDSLFEYCPEASTKTEDKEIHGMGLALCARYCESMGAMMYANSCKIGVKFSIQFSYEQQLKNS